MPHTARCKARFRKPGPGVDVLLPLQMCAHVLGSHTNTISSVLPGGLSEADRLLHLFCSASLCSCSSRFFFSFFVPVQSKHQIWELDQANTAGSTKKKKNVHNHMLSINGDAQGRSAQWLIAFCSHGIRSARLPAAQMLNVLLGFMVEKQRPAQRRKHMRRSCRV